MRVICDRSCQIRIGGVIHTIEEGELLNLDVDTCPEYFHEVGKPVDESGNIDFENVEDSELREMEGDVELLKLHVETNYPEVSFAKNIGWAKLVERYLEARENRVLKIDNTGKVKNTIVNVTRQLEDDKDDALDTLEAELKEDENDLTANDAFDNIDELLGE